MVAAHGSGPVGHCGTPRTITAMSPHDHGYPALGQSQKGRAGTLESREGTEARLNKGASPRPPFQKPSVRDVSGQGWQVDRLKLSFGLLTLVCYCSGRYLNRKSRVSLYISNI